MSWIVDVVIVAFLIIATVIGVYKGAIKGFLGLAFLVANIVLSIWLSKYLASYLMGTSFGDTLQIWVNTWFTGSNEALFNSVLTKTDSELFILYEGVQVPFATALEYAKIPSFLAPTITSAVFAVAESGYTLAQVLVPSISSFIMIILSCVILLIFFAIVFGIIKAFLRKLLVNKAARGIDRVLGAVFGLLKGVLLVLIVFLALNMFSNIPALESTFAAINSSFIGGFIYSTNILQLMLDAFANLQQFFSEAITSMFDTSQIFSLAVKAV